MKIVNPATGKMIREVEQDNAQSIREKYERALEAQKEWASVPVSERVKCISRFGALVRDNIDRLAETLTSEVGKPLKQSYGEIRGAHGRIDYFVLNSERWLTDEWPVESGGTREMIRYEPLGVVANISAWNYPYNVGYNVFLPALIAGNAVLYKPSEYATLTGLAITELMHKAGVPEDVFVCIAGGGEAGQALLDLPLDGYFFTGSYKTGKYIYETVASKMVPVQLELGGKDPLYVADDVDVQKAVVNAAEGAFYNAGQSCCAVERIYVHQAIYDDFVQAFTEEVRSYRVGDPKDEGTFIGPLTRPQQLEVLEQQVEDAKRKGGEVLAGGKRRAGEGYFFEPTVISGANHNMSLMKDESFGPVIGIQKVESDEQAIELMNDTEYGLTAAVFSDDYSRAEAIMNKMNSGTVYWNCCDRVSPTVPWSGRKHSGFGSTLSYQGIRAFTKPKAYQLRG